MGDIVTSGQTETVPAGQTAEVTTVYQGGNLVVLSGGTSVGTYLSGGQEDVQGTASGTTGSSGFQYISDGGVASGTTLSGFSLQAIEDGSTAIGATLVGTQTGNFTAFTTQQIDAGGIASGTNLAGFAVENINPGGEAVNTIGTGSNAINDRGLLVYSAINAQVAASPFDYGSIIVEGASTRVAFTGGTSFFGSFTGLAVIGANTEMEIGQPDMLGTGTILFDQQSGGTLTIDGDTNPTERIAGFYAGDTIIINGQNTASLAVEGNDVQLTFADGTVDTIEVDNAAAGDITMSSGVGSVILHTDLQPSLVITSGTQQSISSTISNYEINNGGQGNVVNGGTAAGGYVANGVLSVQNGGTAAGNLVGDGGLEQVQNGGAAANDTFFEGSTQEVDGGGRSDDASFNGGTLIDNGVAAYGAQSDSPTSATINALSGGGTVEQDGAGILTLGGDASAFSGTVMLNSGTVEIGGGTNLTSADIDFFAGDDPTLQIDGSLNSLPTATISGFATPLDIIDLRGVGYQQNTVSTSFTAYEEAQIVSSGGSTGLGLFVMSAGSTGSLTLDPGTVGSAPVNFFDDGHGGTEVQFSTLSAGSFADLKADIDTAATLSAGTYTIYLTSSFVFANQDGTSDGLDSVQANNGATVVIDGQGHGTSPLNFGSGAQTLTVGGGSVVVEDLTGFVGLTVTNGAHLTVTSDSYGGGTFLLSGTVEVADSGAAGGGNITFGGTSGATELLQVDATALSGGTFSNSLTDFATMSGQNLDLAGFTFSSGVTSATISPDGSTLTVTNGATMDTFTLSGSTAALPLNVFDDANGGTIVTADSVACYVTGTRIRTETGERPVETLAIGDRVVTLSGALRPIRWIGHRSYRGRFLAARLDHMPVRIAAGALADGIPARDLYVSPKHAMFIDGVLVPAAALVNGASIAHVRAADEIGYWHVELETHDVLLAEGAPSESFIDDDSRAIFHNAGDYAVRYPGTRHAPAVYCAPRVEQGAELEVIRTRLAARSRTSLAA